jgi:polysaccharide export outer membrane protein
LRPGDAVRLVVKDDTLLSREYPVLEDGTIVLPLIGRVPVVGHEFQDVEQRVRTAFAGELVDPVVAVSPLVRVAVLGEVRLPGLYVADGTYELADVLARAGGLAPTASLRRISLVRDGTTQKLDSRNGAPVLDGGVRPGDQIVVGRRSWASDNMPVLVGAAASVLAAAVTTLLVR